MTSGLLLLFLVYGIYVIPSLFSRGLNGYFYNAFLIFITVISCLGLYQFFSFVLLGPNQNPLIPYLLPPNLGDRVVGIYGQANLFALCLLLGILVFVYCHLHGTRFFAKPHYLFNKVRYLPIALTCLVFFMTGSRGGLIALGISLAALAFFCGRKGHFRSGSLYRPELFRLLTVLALSFAAYVLLKDYYADEVFRSFNTGGKSDSRFIFWVVALLIFRDYPLLGVGLDNYQFHLPRYVNEAHDLLGFVGYEAMGHTKWAHNEILQLFCELGGGIGIILLGLLALYLLRMFRLLTAKGRCSVRLFFAYLFLLPFIIQSMLSWPLRHPSLLILFFSFLGSLIALEFKEEKQFTRAPLVRFKAPVISIILIGLVYVGYQECRMGLLAQSVKADVAESFVLFEDVAADPYAEFYVLNALTPKYIQYAVEKQDKELLANILPYAQRLVDLQGAHWQWFNIALAYLNLDRDADAAFAMEQSIKLQPTKNKYWALQHYLNMLHASRETGRPLESFLPIPPGGDATDLEGLFDFDDRIKQSIKIL